MVPQSIPEVYCTSYTYLRAVNKLTKLLHSCNFHSCSSLETEWWISRQRGLESLPNHTQSLTCLQRRYSAKNHDVWLCTSEVMCGSSFGGCPHHNSVSGRSNEVLQGAAGSSIRANEVLVGWERIGRLWGTEIVGRRDSSGVVVSWQENAVKSAGKCRI